MLYKSVCQRECGVYLCTGVCVETDLRFRLTIEDAEVSTPSIQVYLDLTHNPFIPGLLPGATVVLHAFQRSVSRCLSHVWGGGGGCPGGQGESQRSIGSLTASRNEDEDGGEEDLGWLIEEQF